MCLDFTISYYPKSCTLDFFFVLKNIYFLLSLWFQEREFLPVSCSKSFFSTNSMHSRSQWGCPAFQPMRESVGHICLFSTSRWERSKVSPQGLSLPERLGLRGCQHTGSFTGDSCLCYAMCLKHCAFYSGWLLPASEKVKCS